MFAFTRVVGVCSFSFNFHIVEWFSEEYIFVFRAVVFIHTIAIKVY